MSRLRKLGYGMAIGGSAAVVACAYLLVIFNGHHGRLLPVLWLTLILGAVTAWGAGFVFIEDNANASRRPPPGRYGGQ